jgi:hypothetical protein
MSDCDREPARPLGAIAITHCSPLLRPTEYMHLCCRVLPRIVSKETQQVGIPSLVTARRGHRLANGLRFRILFTDRRRTLVAVHDMACGGSYTTRLAVKMSVYLQEPAMTKMGLRGKSSHLRP